MIKQGNKQELTFEEAEVESYAALKFVTMIYKSIPLKDKLIFDKIKREQFEREKDIGKSKQ